MIASQKRALVLRPRLTEAAREGVLGKAALRDGRFAEFRDKRHNENPLPDGSNHRAGAIGTEATGS
jgi:hypothetical protein